MIVKIKKSISWVKTWGTLPVFDWISAAELYKKKDFAKALELYERGLERHANHPARYCAILDLAFCYFKAGNFTHSEDLLRKVIKDVPQSKEASVRLARLLSWVGDDLEAVRVLHRALSFNEGNVDLVAELAFALVRNGGPMLIIADLHKTIKEIPTSSYTPKLEVARAVIGMLDDDYRQGRLALITLAGKMDAPFEAYYFFACELLKEGKIANARVHFRNALALSPDHPQTLGKLAESYLSADGLGNLEYANQLALKAAQNSGWRSPREMFILSQSYFELGEKSTALLIASKAKDVSGERIGFSSDIKKIDSLIQDLSHSTIS